MANALDKVVPFPAPVNYEKQSVEVPGTKRPAHYRNSTFGLIDVNTPHALTTLTQAFDIGLALSKDSPCLGHRPLVSKKPLAFADHYVWETYGQIDERRRNVGSALQTWFKDGTLGGGELETVGIWSPNRPEWAIVDWAVVSFQKVCVSLYDTLGKESVGAINHSHLTVIFANAPHLAELIKLAPRTPHVKMIVSLDDLDPDMKRVLDMWGAANNVLIKELREVEEFGRAHPVAVIPAAVDQIATICYTSGTTGVPKGVILTHSQIAMGIQSHLYGFTLDRTNQPRLMSYLPLAHIYERTTSVAVVTLGGSIGYFTGDPLRLIEDCQILKPNFFPSVPRVLNRIYQSAMAAGDVPGLRGNIFRRAVKTKVERLHQDAVVTHPFWDRLVFRKIQAVLGGNIKLIACGSAPVNPDVLDFLRVAFSCTVWEGEYGMTENAAVCCRLMVDDPTSAGTVGPPHPAIELKLIDVPAMKYTAEDRPNPRGEICCRGAVCFSGYYKDEKNTRETIDEEGWLHTGDVGEIDACGRVKIIDRVKNIMKLSQGEYVALEKIENLYMTSPLIAQIFVHGDPLHAYIVAVVVPDPVQLAALVERVTGARVREDDLLKLQALAQEPKVVQAVLALLTAEGKKTLKGFELVKKIHLSMSPFTVENDTLTPTMKIKRKAAYEMYKKELDALYAEPEASDSARAAL
ncbi:acetyl-CoA synthetase-like protein [Amylostereum chailletii]|nr:acetyl-CoA synthetase-like protein [Amylostereum chailletii]